MYNRRDSEKVHSSCFSKDVLLDVSIEIKGIYLNCWNKTFNVPISQGAIFVSIQFLFVRWSWFSQSLSDPGQKKERKKNQFDQECIGQIPPGPILGNMMMMSVSTLKLPSEQKGVTRNGEKSSVTRWLNHLWPFLLKFRDKFSCPVLVLMKWVLQYWYLKVECRGWNASKGSFRRVLILPTSNILFKPTLELFHFEHWKNIYVDILTTSMSLL